MGSDEVRLQKVSSELAHGVKELGLNPICSREAFKI